MIYICYQMKWTYGQYMSQPTQFITELKQFFREKIEAEKQG
jgi:hypothetical protein